MKTRLKNDFMNPFGIDLSNYFLYHLINDYCFFLILRYCLLNTNILIIFVWEHNGFSKILCIIRDMRIWERKKEFVVLGFYIFKNRRKDFHLDIVIVWILYGYERKEKSLVFLYCGWIAAERSVKNELFYM